MKLILKKMNFVFILSSEFTIFFKNVGFTLSFK